MSAIQRDREIAAKATPGEWGYEHIPVGRSLQDRVHDARSALAALEREKPS